jgi:hypothetical protein
MPEIPLLVGILDRAYGRMSWHGVNLRGSVRRVTAADAAWRPGPGRHNIREIVVHAAYWKYAVWRRLTGAPKGSFPVAGSNWFARSTEGGERGWRDDVRLLDRMHARLRAAIAAAPAASLHRREPRLKTTRFDLIAGIAAHDLYHAGQIQLIKALRKPKRSNSP